MPLQGKREEKEKKVSSKVLDAHDKMREGKNPLT